MSWDDSGEARAGEVVTYKVWWAELRAHLDLEAETRPVSDAWRYVISDRLTLVLGARRLVEDCLPDGGEQSSPINRQHRYML
jgi:hypothetical protein